MQVISPARLSEILADLDIVEARLAEHENLDEALALHTARSTRHGADLKSHAAAAREFANGATKRTACERSRLRIRRCALLNDLMLEGIPQNRWVSCEDRLIYLQLRPTGAMLLHRLPADARRWIPQGIDEAPENTRRRAHYAARSRADNRQLYAAFAISLAVSSLILPVLQGLIPFDQSVLAHVCLLVAVFWILPGARRRMLDFASRGVLLAPSPWRVFAPSGGRLADQVDGGQPPVGESGRTRAQTHNAHAPSDERTRS